MVGGGWGMDERRQENLNDLHGGDGPWLREVCLCKDPHLVGFGLPNLNQGG